MLSILAKPQGDTDQMKTLTKKIVVIVIIALFIFSIVAGVLGRHL